MVQIIRTIFSFRSIMALNNTTASSNDTSGRTQILLTLQDIRPSIAVYILATAGLVLHLGVLRKLCTYDPLIKRSSLLISLSLVNICLCANFILGVTLANSSPTDYTWNIGNIRRQYGKGVMFFHFLLVNFITFDNFLKIRLAYRYDEDKMEKKWVILIIFSIFFTIVLTILQTKVFPPGVMMVFLIAVSLILLINLATTYIYIMHIMVKQRLEQPQVVGYFVDTNGRPISPQKRLQVRSKKRLTIPPSVVKVMYSKPMLVLLLHVFFQIFPLLSTFFVMFVRRKKPSRLHLNVTYILGSSSICIEALVYLFLDTMILRHLVTQSRIHPSHRTPPAPQQATAAVVLRDYNWTLASSSTQSGRNDALQLENISVTFSSI